MAALAEAGSSVIRAPARDSRDSRALARRLAMTAGWGILAALPLAGVLFEGRVLYFRDVSVTYYPDLVFLERSLRQGIWPLWHPGADAGAPHLACYPLHLVLVALLGAKATLAFSPWLHLLLGMAGTGWLARRVGTGPRGSFVAGAVFGLSGFMLGSLLYPIFLAAAWTPAVVAAALALAAAPSARRVATLAVLLAMQVSTLGAEALPQTALLALVLLQARPRARALGALSAALGLAALLAAPVLAGAAWQMKGTARAAGFPPEVGLSYSASLPVLLESVLPRFLGDPHTFTEAGFWGQPFFHGGSPFFLSLYLGPAVLALALAAGRREWRLWALVATGALLASGAHGPLAPWLAPAMQVLRVPAKFFLLATVAAALLAGRGLERATARSRAVAPAAGGLLLGALLLAVAFASTRSPGELAAALATVIPAAAGPLARGVIASVWPAEWAITGILTLAAGLALVRGGRVVALAGLLAVLDLARVGAPLNAGASSSFYDLRPEVAALVDGARREGRYRWHSYGVGLSPALTWHPDVSRRNSDAWLFYFDRQSLLPRTQVLDQLDGAFDLDRMGLAPAGATFAVDEAGPASFRSQHERLRAANVRWVMSFVDLPGDLVLRRGQVRFPELAQPLSLFELRNPLPRAYFAGEAAVSGVGEPADPARARVEYESPDPHTVILRCDTPPGQVVVLDGHHGDWVVDDGTALRPVPRLGRYRLVPTPGGRRVLTLRFRPAWVGPALAAAVTGLLITFFLVTGCVRFHRTSSTAAC